MSDCNGCWNQSQIQITNGHQGAMFPCERDLVAKCDIAEQRKVLITCDETELILRMQP